MFKYKLISLKYKLRKLPRKRVIFWSTFVLIFLISMGSIVRYYAVASFGVSDHASAIDGDKVYVNDLQADWDYYQSLNYTEIRSRTGLPTYQEKYTDKTLVPVMITYDGVDYNDNLDASVTNKKTGFVSRTEAQSKYIYFKYYYSTDKKITIELIDNPFTRRPNNMGFNGWGLTSISVKNAAGDVVNPSDGTTSLSKATISHDSTYYVRYLTVDLDKFLSASDSPGDLKVEIQMNAFWTLADYTTNSGSFTNNLKTVGMYHVGEKLTSYTGTFPSTTHFDYCVLPSTSFYEQLSITRGQRHSGSVYYHENYAQSVGNNKVSTSNSFTCNQDTCYFYVKVSSAYCDPRKDYYTITGTGNNRVANLSNGSKEIRRLDPSDSSKYTTYFFKDSSAHNGVKYYSVKGVVCDSYASDCQYRLLQASDSDGSWSYISNSSKTAVENNATVYNSLVSTAVTKLCNRSYVEYNNCSTIVTSGNITLDTIGGNISLVGGYYNFTKNVSDDVFEATYYKTFVDGGGNTVTEPMNITNFMNDLKQEFKILVDMKIYENKASYIANYYYLVTRDTNIYECTSNCSFVSQSGYAYTITGSAFGATGTRSMGGTLTAVGDLALENINFNGNGNIDGAGKNMKLGRGFTSSSNSKIIYGKSNSGSNYSHRVIVESGSYNSMQVQSGGGSNVNAQVILGSDYDRVTNNDTKLNFSYQVAASISGSYTGSDSIVPSSEVTVKSGIYGSNITSAITDYFTYGIYAGSLENGSNNALRVLNIQGGKIFAVNGGPCIDNNIGDKVETAVYMTGGYVTNLTGGAGASTTYGNRLISVSGGIVANAVNGGSNSSAGGNNIGPLNGDTLVYVGGSATIGDRTHGYNYYWDGYTNSGRTSTSALYYVTERGSVFGAGLGSSSSSNYGKVKNSHVIINGGTILGSVYGGGNYGSTGTISNVSSKVTIELLGGNVKGSVFGGANQANSGFTDNSEGTVTNNLAKDYYYVSSPSKVTTVYTSTRSVVATRVCKMSGTDNLGNSYDGTRISSNNGGRCDKRSTGGWTGNVRWNNGANFEATTYAYGTPSGETVTTQRYIPAGSILLDGTRVSSDTACTKTNGVYVDTNSTDSFSGNWSPSSVPETNKSTSQSRTGTSTSNSNYSCSYISVSSLTRLSAGSQASFDSNKYYYVLLDDGTYQRVYSFEYDGDMGVTNTLKHSIDIKLKGSTIDNGIYGGSNVNGTVYGNVDINLVSGSSVNVFGGGKGNPTIVRGTTNVTSSAANNSDLSVTSVYGGSEEGSVNGYNSGTSGNPNLHIIGQTNVNISGGTIGYVYGGGKGNTTTSKTPTTYGPIKVTVNKGIVRESVFGGNDLLGEAKNMRVVVNGGTINRVFGGSNGSGARSTNTDVKIKGGTIQTAVYGGGNEASATDTKVEVTGGSFYNIPEADLDPLSDVSTDAGTIYGGGRSASVNNTVVTISAGAHAFDVFGGGLAAGASKTTVTIDGGTAYKVYGGSNESGLVANSNVIINGGTIKGNVYGGGLLAPTTTSNVTLNAGTFDTSALSGGRSASDAEVFKAQKGNAFGGGKNAAVTTANITLQGSTLVGVYGGSNNGGIVQQTNVNIKSGNVANVFGGNNIGGSAVKTKVILDGSYTVSNVYGGGNGVMNANNDMLAGVYNQDGRVNGAETRIIMRSGHVTGDIYGGGNDSLVLGTTRVDIVKGNIDGSIYGAGRSAFVGNIYTTKYVVSDNFIEEGAYKCDVRVSECTSGHTHDPAAYSFSAYTPSTTINIANAKILGDVFGSGSFSFVHGNTTINLGNDAVKALTGETIATNKSIEIRGDVYTGSYASTSLANLTEEELEHINYEYSIIGVEGNTYLNLDGTGYSNKLSFGYNGKGGSIYGDGSNSRVSNLVLDSNLNTDASADTKSSYIRVMKVGSSSNPLGMASISRANTVKLIDSYVELTGARNMAEATSSERRVKYSFVDVYHLYFLGSQQGMSYGTTGYLFGGATKLRNFYSGYLNGNTFVKENFIVDGTAPNVGNVYKNKNVDNRIYLPDGTAFIISKNKYDVSDTSGVGIVQGMTFIGIYSPAYRDGSGYDTGIYSKNHYGVDENVTDADNVVTGYTYAYASAYTDSTKTTRLATNPEWDDTKDQVTTVDGFFSNFFIDRCLVYNEETGENEEDAACVASYPRVQDRYVVRTYYAGLEPPNTTTDTYKWYIGESSLDLEIELEASRYGIKSVGDLRVDLSEVLGMNAPMFEIDRVNTSNFGATNYGNSLVDYSTTLVDYSSIPFIRNGYEDIVNDSGDTIRVPDANRYFALVMGTNTTGWLGNYSTSFYSNRHQPGNICSSSGFGSCVGTKQYYYDSQPASTVYRNLTFSLYYSNNIDTTLMLDPDEEQVSLGYIIIYTKVKDTNAPDNSVNASGLNVAIRVKVYITNEESDGYGYSRAPGKKYEIFPNQETNITNKSSFSVNQNLHLNMGDPITSTHSLENWTIDKVYSNNIKHILTSTVVYPAGTRISMIDLVDGKQYYYDVVASDSHISGTNLVIPLGDFVAMSNVSGTMLKYDDSADANKARYYFNNATVDESFIFIVDFYNSSSSPPFGCVDQGLYLELRHGDLAIASDPYALEALNKYGYSVYGSDQLTLQTSGGFVGGGGDTSSNPVNIYMDETKTIQLTSDMVNESGSSVNISNTIYDDYQLGAILKFKDSNGNVLTYDRLDGLVVTVNGKSYSPENSGEGGEGLIRLNLAGRITSVVSDIQLDFSNVSSSSLPVGSYTLVIESFGSYDGLYYGGSEVRAEDVTLYFNLLSNVFGLNAYTQPASVTHDVYTGKDENGNRVVTYTVESENGLARPHLVVSMDRVDNSSGTISYTQLDVCEFAEKIDLYDEDGTTLLSTVTCGTSSTVNLLGGNTSASYYDLGAISNAYDTVVEYKVKITLRDGATSGSSLWKSGTYRIMFTVTDSETGVQRYIGQDYEYLIIRSLGVDEYDGRS